jgi:uncharacterized SAM-binding protein YcdF (DUF218 family)
MMGRAVVVILLVAVLVAGVSAYLSPDDLADCSGVSEGERGSCSAAGAIVVISGGDTQARTSEAITLFNDGWAPLIIFSGAAADKDGPSNAAVMRQQAVEAGVPVSATIIEDLSETTKQNAEQVREHLRANSIDDIILVTSGYHMRRANLEFAGQNAGVVVAEGAFCRRGCADVYEHERECIKPTSYELPRWLIVRGWT